MIILSITFLLSGLLIFLACLPLFYRKIPMNSLYGMRTKSSFRSEEAWYHLNEVGGMVFAMIGFPMIMAGSIGFFLPESMLNILSYCVTAVTFLSLFAAIFFFVVYSNRYVKNV